MSPKRWANLRSDLAGAIDASGLLPMLKTKDIELDSVWGELLHPIKDQRVSFGLSRFARWASLHRIAPEDVDDAIMDRFVAELQACTLIREMLHQPRRVATVQVPSNKAAPTRFPWEQLSGAFHDEVPPFSPLPLRLAKARISLAGALVGQANGSGSGRAAVQWTRRRRRGGPTAKPRSRV
jgi:hypothetical protein